MARAIDADEAILQIERREKHLVGDLFISVDAMKEFIKNRPTIAPKQEWISVKDRLPEKWQDALCFHAGNLMDVYTWTGEKWEDSYGYYEDDDIITHWMP
ncbi:MAG: DUF551 domain-containing protein, partial [Anaerotignum sp.]|nr:DUF551 domain-containing protein [Anaerotignum sp.]